jgi:hypothetical protein
MSNCPLCAKSVRSVTDYTSIMSFKQAQKLERGEITLADIYPMHSNFKKCNHYLYAKCDGCGGHIGPATGCNSYWYAENIITVCDKCDRELT